jgi:hypothetical protein
MSLRRAAFLAALASAACACDSPYRDRGVLSQDVADRLGRLDGADLAQIGEAGPLPPNAAAPPSPDELAVLEPGQRKQAVDLSDVRAAVLEHNLGIKVARIDPAIANERVLRERAAGARVDDHQTVALHHGDATRGDRGAAGQACGGRG